MNIGLKIKEARTKANLTQEQAAEKLMVSRQTISSWENEKTYPDIISVIRMSDLYNISLDRLLKEGNTMSEYLNYLDESTNRVKSRKKLSLLLLIATYLIIWSIALLIFWIYLNVQESDNSIGYVLLVFWLILPLTTLIVSIFIGKINYGRYVTWLSVLFFGIMYMLMEYGTFSLANMLTFNKFNLPQFSMIIIGSLISLVGIVIGKGIDYLISKRRNKG